MFLGNTAAWKSRTCWYIVAFVLVALAMACGGNDGDSDERGNGSSAEPTRLGTVDAELDDDPSLPGEYVNIPELYGAYGEYEPHVLEDVAYEAEQGLPPAGGPHWGRTACPPDPSEAPPNCGPVPWGVYREPWPAASMVHNIEHGGVIVWYNSEDEAVIAALEQQAAELLRAGRLLVLATYPDLEPEQIAITSWTRRDTFPASEYTPERVEEFLDAHERRFNPEQF